MVPSRLKGASASAGPVARISTVFAVVPPTTNPAVRVPPAFTCARQDRLPSRGVAGA